MSNSVNYYVNLEIRIQERREVGYPVEIRLNNEQEFSGGFLAADILSWVASGNPQVDGERLFEILFADQPLRDAWTKVLGQYPKRRIHLRLDTTAPELHALPWELLHDGNTFLAAHANTPFSRYLPLAIATGDLITERPIRVLVAIANPADLDVYNLASLAIDTERANLSAAFAGLEQHFELEFLEPPITLNHLADALRRCHILHFVGHGVFSQRQQQATLYLQDEAGNTQVVTESELTNMLRRQSQADLPQLVVLATCQSATRSTLDAFAGLGPRLVQSGVPAVVAMQEVVAIETARAFTHAFYATLTECGLVDVALNAARSQLLTAGCSDAAIPVLFMRLPNGKLWETLWVLINPYRGLAAFTEKDTEFFYGREKLVQELINHLHTGARFLAVVGPSGSGKSSVVQAGLIPELRQGTLQGSQKWDIIIFRPGSNPYAHHAWNQARADVLGATPSFSG